MFSVNPVAIWARKLFLKKYFFNKNLVSPKTPKILFSFCLTASLTIISGDVYIKSAQSGFFVGQVSEGQFEYSDLNGWMTPREAAKICEKDKKCGGFTYKVTITKN